MSGRKKLRADIAELKDQCKEGMMVQNLAIQGLRAGDDEGTIEFRLLQNGHHMASISLMISDTVGYPEEHACFAFVEEELSHEVRKIIEDMASEIPRTLKETVIHLVSRISQALAGELGGDKSVEAHTNRNNDIEEERGHRNGRKKFIEDLTELQDEWKKGKALRDIFIRGLIASDAASSVEFRLVKNNKLIASVTLVLLDAAEYPKGHKWFAYTQEEVPSPVTEIMEGLAFESGPRTLKGAITHLVSKISSALSWSNSSYNHFHEATGVLQQLSGLRKDFQEIVSAGYRPGITRWSHREFVVSVSVSLLELGVPSTTLAAWDRKLLSTHQHFTLLISGIRDSYPLFKPDGSVVPKSSNVRFYVGLSLQYKPSKEAIFGLTHGVAFDEAVVYAPEEVKPAPDLNSMTYQELETFVQAEKERQNAEKEEEDAKKAKAPDRGRFERFALSTTLESLLNEKIFELIRIRLTYGVGWAGAELLLDEALRTASSPDELHAMMQDNEIRQADRDEVILSSTYRFPPDPLSEYDTFNREEINFPLVAYCYLIRRLMLCSLFCLICHRKLKADFVALKPYVCNSDLCAHQFYEFGFGPSMEYEVRTNPEVVDLLVSLAYVSAAEGQMDNGFPIGLGLRVTPPDGVGKRTPGQDGLVCFDELTLGGMRRAIIELIDLLPKITTMKKYLDEQNHRNSKRKISLQKMDPDVPLAAWKILRWIIASSTAYLEILSPDEQISGIDAEYRQYRFSVGSPDAENKFSKAVSEAKSQFGNANNYLPLYAFHGSPLKNWHSIIRQGLLIKTPLHGRARGNGVYFATDGSVSMRDYAREGTTRWKNSATLPVSCLVLAELVNLPHHFVCSCNRPCFVVDNTSWIMTRYLLVKTAEAKRVGKTSMPSTQLKIPTVDLDPIYPAHVRGVRIGIPEHSYKLKSIFEAMRESFRHEDYDADDQEVLGSSTSTPSPSALSRRIVDTLSILESKDRGSYALVSDWRHEAQWTAQGTYRLMPPPVDASRGATIAVQRELRAILKEQENATSLGELGFYMPPELISDNLFQWIVELHSFDPNIPIAQDMKATGCNSILFEIRFPPSYPLSPPFFRIIKPRFLPFIHGGGGHVTGGGSICIDLLTTDGWIPTYTISAILLQIKLAISNLEPRPARLAPNWNVPYEVAEALAGYKRAADAHGWKIPAETDRLFSS